MSDLGSQRLKGRVALVSGAVRGIGLACVERFWPKARKWC